MEDKNTEKKETYSTPNKKSYVLPVVLLIIIALALLLLVFVIKGETKTTPLVRMNTNQVPDITNIFQTAKNTEIRVIDELGRPFSVTKDAEENIYICDFGDHSVKVYSSDLEIQRKIGGIGEKNGQFNMPHAVDFDSDGNVYVTDYGNKRVQKFSPEGKFLSILESPKELLGPATSYFDQNYNLYVSDFGSNSVLKFSEEGKFLGWIGAKSDGTLTDGWETEGLSAVSKLPGGFDRVHSARVDSQGQIYTVDTWNHRIEKFSEEGKFLGWIGAKSDGTLTDGWELTGSSSESAVPGGFNAPIALDLVNDEEFIVLEYGNHRLNRFSSDGKFIGWFGQKEDGTITNGFEKDGLSREGTQLGSFLLAYDFKVYNNTIYVADTGNRRIQIIKFYE